VESACFGFFEHIKVNARIFVARETYIPDLSFLSGLLKGFHCATLCKDFVNVVKPDNS